MIKSNPTGLTMPMSFVAIWKIYMGLICENADFTTFITRFYDHVFHCYHHINNQKVDCNICSHTFDVEK